MQDKKRRQNNEQKTHVAGSKGSSDSQHETIQDANSLALSHETSLTDNHAGENKFSKLFENCGFGVFLLDDVFLDVNTTACQMLGYTHEEFLRQTPKEISPRLQFGGRNTEEVIREIRAKAMSGESQFFQWQSRTKNGELRELEITLSDVEWEGRKSGLGIVCNVTDRNRMERMLKDSETRLAVKNRIANIFLSIPDDQVYAEVLDVVLSLLSSQYGFFGYIDDNGDLVCPSMTRKVWSQCQMQDKSIVLRREIWGGMWGRSLKEKRAFYSNGPLFVPHGHINLENVLLAPIIFENKLIGQIAVANKSGDYTDEDLEKISEIVKYIAPVLRARQQRDRMDAELGRQAKALNNHIKELNCLHSISRLLENNAGHFSQIVDKIVPIVAKAFRYPNNAMVHIEIDGKIYASEGYQDTIWKHRVPIMVHGRDAGSIEVCYSELSPELESEPFLKEEVKLLQAVSERIGKVLIRKITEIELQRVRKEADTANRIKNEFLANISHELRTPLTAILGYAELMPQMTTDEKVADMAKIISTNGEHLMGLINDILDLSKIEMKQIQVESLSCSPVEVVNQIVSLFKDKADAKGLRLAANFLGNIPDFIMTDSARFRQILMSLIGNAVKFTEQGGIKIVVRYPAENDDKDKIQFEIIDSGIGMLPQQMAELFKPFVQGDSSTTRRYEGSGLGLAITKRLIELLGGEIRVASTPGEGSHFVFTIAAKLQRKSSNAVLDMNDSVAEPTAGYVSSINYGNESGATS